MTKQNSNARMSRRAFVGQCALGSAAAMCVPAIVTSAKTDTKSLVMGAGEHTYEPNHHWAQLPEKFTWQTTQDVTIDSQGYVYIIHQGRLDKPDHDAIFVFEPNGRYVRSFGKEFQGGGHGLEIRREGSDEFLYVSAYHQKRSFAKLSTKGEVVWRKYAPMESGVYARGEEVQPRSDNPWGRDRFLPTNFAFSPTGGFYLADGYGAFRIHRFDADTKWLSSFGGPSGQSKANGTFKLPHGLAIDARRGEPSVVVADRENARLQWFTLDGHHVRTLDGFILPANVDVRGKVLLVPDLGGRVTLLDREDQVIAQLGDDSERISADSEFKIRADESKWEAGKFVHPHDACFDAHGNIYVVDWVERGRISKLRRVS
jgi:hypothetical protein